MGNISDILKAKQKSGIVAKALAGVRSERVKEAEKNLSRLLKQRDMALKALKNVERELEEEIFRIEQDEEDLGGVEVTLKSVD